MLAVELLFCPCFRASPRFTVSPSPSPSPPLSLALQSFYALCPDPFSTYPSLSALQFCESLFSLTATVGSDPADITWLYESPPGFVLLCLRLYALVWFIRAILITRHKYTRKRGFYWKFALAAHWMFALFWGLIAFMRSIVSRFVFAFNITVNAIFFILQFYLSPNRYNRAFPFHADERREPGRLSQRAED